MQFSPLSLDVHILPLTAPVFPTGLKTHTDCALWLCRMLHYTGYPHLVPQDPWDSLQVPRNPSGTENGWIEILYDSHIIFFSKKQANKNKLRRIPH